MIGDLVDVEGDQLAAAQGGDEPNQYRASFMSPRNTAVPAQEVFEKACPLREVLDRGSGKWSVQILVAAVRGPIRFTELERSIDGISRRMLTLTLRNLERDGLLERTVYPTVPARVEYTATSMARELHSHLLGLTGWAENHRSDIATARRTYDARTNITAGLQPAQPLATRTAAVTVGCTNDLGQ